MGRLGFWVWDRKKVILTKLSHKDTDVIGNIDRFIDHLERGLFLQPWHDLVEQNIIVMMIRDEMNGTEIFEFAFAPAPEIPYRSSRTN